MAWCGVALQFKDGRNQYGVQQESLLLSARPIAGELLSPRFEWKSWTSWNKQASEAVDRSFNYPHVAAAYWVLYHLARNHQGLVTSHSWDWYLEHAYETAMAMTKFAGVSPSSVRWRATFSSDPG